MKEAKGKSKHKGADCHEKKKTLQKTDMHELVNEHPLQTSLLAIGTQQLPGVLLTVGSLVSDPMLHTSPQPVPQQEHCFGLQLPSQFI